jgi:hypothetical protein
MGRLEVEHAAAPKDKLGCWRACPQENATAIVHRRIAVNRCLYAIDEHASTKIANPPPPLWQGY